MGVVDGQPNHGAHQLKLHGHVYFGRPEPVHACLLVQLEHAVVWVKHVTHQQLEELLRTCRGHMTRGVAYMHFIHFPFYTSQSGASCDSLDILA